MDKQILGGRIMSKINCIKSAKQVVSRVKLVSNQGNVRDVKLVKNVLPTLQNGNMKIVNTDKFDVICWSIASQATLNFVRKSVSNYSDEYTKLADNTLCHNCESCVGGCYNLKAYRRTTILKSRFSNFYHTFDANFVHNMVTLISRRNEKSKSKGKKLFVRLHVDGEIYSYEYGLKLMDICRAFVCDDNVVFYTYTKSYHIVERLEAEGLIPSNLNINLSLYDDMDEQIQKYVLASKNNVFYSSKDESFPLVAKAKAQAKVIKLECNGFNCANCSYCAKLMTNKVMITCPIH